MATAHAQEYRMADILEARRVAADRNFGGDFEMVYERTQSTPLQPNATPLLGKREEISSLRGNWWKRSHYTQDFQTGQTVRYASDIDWLSGASNLRLEGPNAAAISDYRSEGNMARRLYFTRHLGVNLRTYFYKSRELPPEFPESYSFDGFPYLDADILDSDRHYEIMPSEITVQGNQCLLLQSKDFDQIVVCPAFDFSIVSRQLNWEPGGPRRIDIRNSDFKHHDLSAWLPEHQQVTEYAFPGDPGGLVVGDPLHQSIYRLVKYTTNAGSISFTPPSVPPGAVIVNNITDEVYRVPSGAAVDPFDEQIIESLRRIAEAPRASNSRRYFVFVNVALIAGAIVLYAYRSSRQ